jgi:hypothetical protein
VGNLLELHEQAGIQLRVLPSLWPFWDAVIVSTLGFSGIRLKNAAPDERGPAADRGRRPSAARPEHIRRQARYGTRDTRICRRYCAQGAAAPRPARLGLPSNEPALLVRRRANHDRFLVHWRCP